MKELTHGIVGIGDLGAQLRTWLESAKQRVIVFDNIVSLDDNQASLSALLEQADVIHWCAPLDSLPDDIQLHTSQHLLLHASVMHQSLNKKQAVQDQNQDSVNIDILHMLMNPSKRVVVATESSDAAWCQDLMATCGFTPIIRSVKQHDRMMAVSQAPMALLHELILDELTSLEADALLTPSATELLAAIRARAAKWTPTTMQSILSNREIQGLIDQMQSLLKTKH